MGIRLLITAVGYFLLARLGYLFAATPYGVSPVWPAAGFALWSSLRWGPHMSWAIGASTFFFMRQNNAPWIASIGVGIGNALNPWMARYFSARIREPTPEHPTLPQVQKESVPLDPSPTELLRFLWYCCVVPAGTSAFIGNLSLSGFYLFTPEPLTTHFLGWLLGDSLGSFIFGLFLIHFARGPIGSVKSLLFPNTSKWEFLFTLLVTLFVTLLCFANWLVPYPIGVQIKYLVLPILIWAALRYTLSASILINLVLATTSIILLFLAHLQQDFPFTPGTFTGRFDLINLQGFLAFTCGTSTMLVCSVEERSRMLLREEAARKAALQAISTRDEFLSIAAHELRTPLTPLSLHLQMVELWMTESKQLRENAPRFFDLLARGLPVALDQVRKLERLVDDLLDTTRLTQGKLRLQLVILDLSEMLRSYLEIRSSDLQAQKISISWHIDPQLGIQGDRERLEQVMDNLIFNSIRYAKGSPIRVTLESQPEEKISLKVRDWGSGVPIEGRERLFQKFERFHPSTEHGGLGIGLFLCRQIVEGHEGTIRYLNPPDGERGALFEVILPKISLPSPDVKLSEK